MNFLKRLFGGSTQKTTAAVPGAVNSPKTTGETPHAISKTNTADEVPRAVSDKYGIHVQGGTFVFQGAYEDGMRASLSTPSACADQVRQLTMQEVCILMADPVLVILSMPGRKPLAIRTSLPATRAQEFVDGVRCPRVSTYGNGKVCVLRLKA